MGEVPLQCIQLPPGSVDAKIKSALQIGEGSVHLKLTV